MKSLSAAPRLHRSSLVVDLHTDALYEHTRGRRDITIRSDRGHLDLPRMREGGVNAQVFAVWNNPLVFRRGQRLGFVLRACAAFRRICRSRADTIALALGPGDVDRIVSSGRIAGILGVEGGHALDADIGNLDRLSRAGARVFTLTWNSSNELGYSCMRKDGSRRGLTRLGREAVRRLNRLGMVIDLSHASERTFRDTLEASAAPVICSHSACHALRRFPRNLTDAQLKALGRAGGVIGIVFLPYFIRRHGRQVTLDHILDHVEHAAAVAGIDAVALGSDFDGFSDPPPRGLEDVTRMPNLTAGLLRRGFSDRDVRKVLGLNFLRVWRAVESRAGQAAR